MGKKEENRKKRSFIPVLIGWIGVFLFVFLIRYFLLQSYRISTSAMEDTLRPGDFVLVNKLPGKDNPARNRVILLASPLLKDTLQKPLLVSRCVGMPGDTIEVTADGYVVNGKLLPRPPQSLNEYRIKGTLAEKFSQITRELKIPRRNREVKDFDLHTVLTSFEEYLIREELTPEENEMFMQIQPDMYKLVLPKKNRPHRLDSLNIEFFKNAILSETNEPIIFKDGKLFRSGQERAFFTFTQDYYWVLSDNNIDDVDSRYLGIIPEDHITGNVWVCWYSKEKKQWFKLIK